MEVAESFLLAMYANPPEGMSAAKWELISAKTALRVARWLLGKKHATVPFFPSLDAIMKKHGQEREHILGGGTCLEPKDEVVEVELQTLSSNSKFVTLRNL